MRKKFFGLSILLIKTKGLIGGKYIEESLYLLRIYARYFKIIFRGYHQNYIIISRRMAFFHFNMFGNGY